MVEKEQIDLVDENQQLMFKKQRTLIEEGAEERESPSAIKINNAELQVKEQQFSDLQVEVI